MPEKLRLDIDEESFKRLTAIAVEERRPINWQAEVLLLRAIAQWCTPSLRIDHSEAEPAGVREKV
jgi:hypothetical protein